MDGERSLKVVTDDNLCQFTKMVGGKKFVCTKAKHREEQGHSMVSEKEAKQHGWR